MKTLYIECAMGAAGDMLAAALLELLPDRAAFLEKMNGLGIPGVTVSAEKGVKCGVSGTHFSVRVAGVEEDENLHSHHHDHVHGSMEGIEEIVNRLPIPSMVKLDVLAVYNLIAEAESRVHGVSGSADPLPRGRHHGRRCGHHRRMPADAGTSPRSGDRVPRLRGKRHRPVRPRDSPRSRTGYRAAP